MKGLGFDYFASRNPDAPAVVDPGGATWSRGRLATLAHNTARALAAAGAAEGQVLAIVARNAAEYLAVCLAGLRTGLHVVPVNWHLGRGELDFVLEDAEPFAVAADAALGHARLGEIAKRSTRAKQHISLRGRAPGYVELEAFAAAASVRPFAPRRRGRIMPYTSATTGRPKAVQLPVANAQAALGKFIEWHVSLGVEPEAGNVHLCAAPLYHSAPLEGAVVALEMGHTVVLADAYSPHGLLESIERYRVTTTFLVPTMLVRLLKLPEPERRRFSTTSLRFVVHGGAPCPIEVKRRMIDWWGAVVWEAYGASEAQGTIVSAEEWLRRPGTVGRPIAGSAIRILDEGGRELPAGAEGLIYIRPHNGDRFEYKGDPVKTAACWRGDLVTVGDIGHVDERGFLFLRDRQNDVILSSGANIYPAEIEHALIEHPVVVDCAVIGIPDELFGEVPKAFVQLQPGITPDRALTIELLRFVGERLAPTKLPKRIEYRTALPRDPNGKLYRRRLRSTEGRDLDRS